MFGLGFWEIAVILAVALLVLGPSKLPDLAKSLGKGLREFRKATEDFKSTIQEEAYKEEARPPAPPQIAQPPSSPQEAVKLEQAIASANNAAATAHAADDTPATIEPAPSGEKHGT